MSAVPDLGGVLGLGPVRHLGCVVSRLEDAVARLSNTGIRVPWNGWTYGPDYLGWQRVGGEPADFAARIAVSAGEAPQLELIEPLTSGSSWAQALEHGEGTLHHAGFFVDDLWGELERMNGLGLRTAEVAGGHGLDGDGALAYVDARPVIGIFVELITPPARRAAPHFVFERAQPH